MVVNSDRVKVYKKRIACRIIFSGSSSYLLMQREIRTTTLIGILGGQMNHTIVIV